MKTSSSRAERDLWALATELWGRHAVKGMVSEECGELLAAINQYDRGRVDVDRVAEEIADVLGVISHLAYQLGITPKKINTYSDEKFRRFRALVNNCARERRRKAKGLTP